MAYYQSPDRNDLIAMCTGRSISPPQKSSGGQHGLDNIMQRIDDDSSTAYYLSADDQSVKAALIFLDGRDFFGDDDDRRKSGIVDIVAGTGHGGAFERLMTIFKNTGNIDLTPKTSSGMNGLHWRKIWKIKMEQKPSFRTRLYKLFSGSNSPRTVT